jgi:hypothetical protein
LPEPASPASTPTLSPAQLAEAAARSRRDSGVQIDDQDVVGEEEIHAPLSGSYRLSSLRLIDEAVAAAQLIEPSLYEPEELERLGSKPKPPEEKSAAATEEAAAVARVKAELTTSDPSIDVPPAEQPAVAESTEEAPRAAQPAAEPLPPNGGRARKKTVPPPIPRAPAKVSPKELDDVPMLDSAARARALGSHAAGRGPLRGTASTCEYRVTRAPPAVG